MKKPVVSLALLVTLLLCAAEASAFPGFVVGRAKGGGGAIHSGHVVLMRMGGTNALTMMPDYNGPISDFALVLAVPSDTTIERVATLRREFVDRVAHVSAPRFHEWWEMDPCDPSPVKQEWERNKKASSSTAFLGGGGDGKPRRKVPKELLLTVVPEFKVQGEYAFTLLEPEQKLSDWISEHGYQAPAGLAKAEGSLSSDFRFLIAEVDTKKIELTGSGQAVLSPIRVWTEQAVDVLPVRLGLLSMDKHQELQVFVLDHQHRFVPKNYPVVTPPTNIRVDFKVKERMGEFFGALHDKLLDKNPGAFLAEYAWAADECGEPCATEPMMIHELLSLGADVFEASVPDEEKNPEPPELTEEEQEKQDLELKPLKPKERKKIEEERQEEREEVARRKALVKRHKYVLSRLHYRYDSKSLPKELELRAEPKSVKGGVDLPKGKEGKLPLDIKDADKNTLQMRYVHFHPWKGVLKCEEPKRWRWGKAPRTYRGLRKIWVAEDLARKNRTQIKLPEVVMTPIPTLGLSGKPLVQVADAGVDAGSGTVSEESGKSCGCRVAGTSRDQGWVTILLLGLIALAHSRRRQA